MNTESNVPSFSARMADILNGGALTAAIAIGYRTDLFEAMAAMEAPADSAAIALKAGLDERYVREWLGVMGTGGIVHMERDAVGGVLYQLPAHHAACLTRSAGSANLAVYCQEIPLLTRTVMEAVIDAFKSGDGVPYSRYTDFQAFMTELSNAKHRRVLVSDFLPSVDRGRLVERLESGIRVCDLGCGEGVSVHVMAKAFPNSRFIGVDVDPAAIAKARAGALEMGIANADFELQDAVVLGDLPRFQGTCDYIIALDAIHDQTAPLEALCSIRKMLAPAGIFSMIDIAAHSDPISNADHPMGAFLYTVSLMHCMPVGRVNGGLGLGMMWGRQQAVDLLEAAGFDQVEVSPFPNDDFNLHYQCRLSPIGTGAS
ncbi:MAG: class I SAM-dependent methyltransferase [Desulfobacterales bacterium]